MSAPTSSPKQLLQDFVVDFYSRRLLLDYNFYPPLTAAPPRASGNSHESLETNTGDNSFDTNVVMVLAVLLCVLICSLGLNSIIRWALRCSNLVASDSGVKRKSLKTFPTVSFSAELNLPGLETECAICLSEFTNGERVRLLPRCNHGFHVRCIDKWLSSRSSCPKCRHCLIETCQNIVGCSQASSSEPLPTVQEVTESIAPPEREVCAAKEGFGSL